MATNFGFLYMWCTLAPPGEYDRAVNVRRRCGLMSNYLLSNYFDPFLVFIIRPIIRRIYMEMSIGVLQKTLNIILGLYCYYRTGSDIQPSEWRHF